MKEETSLVYTLVLGVSILLSLLLIGQMLLHRDAAAPPAAQPPAVTLTEQELAELAGGALPFAVDGLTVQIRREGTVSVSAAVTRQTLENSGLPAALRTALRFLPDPCRLRGEWRVEQGEDGLRLAAVRLSVAGLAVPDEAAARVTDALTQGVRRWMEERGAPSGTVQCRDGGIALQP